MSWVDVVDNGTQGGHVQHSAPLTWRKYKPGSDYTLKDIQLTFQRTLKHELPTLKKEENEKHLFSAQRWRIIIVTWKMNLRTIRPCWQNASHLHKFKGFNIHFLTSPFVLASVVLSTFVRLNLFEGLLFEQKITKTKFRLSQTFKIKTFHLILL